MFYASFVAAVCALPKDAGASDKYVVMWYFDPSYGDCTRFWYGGSEGNENRFATRAECEQRCKSPPDTGQ